MKTNKSQATSKTNGTLMRKDSPVPGEIKMELWQKSKPAGEYPEDWIVIPILDVIKIFDKIENKSQVVEASNVKPKDVNSGGKPDNLLKDETEKRLLKEIEEVEGGCGEREIIVGNVGYVCGDNRFHTKEDEPTLCNKCKAKLEGIKLGAKAKEEEILETAKIYFLKKYGMNVGNRVFLDLKKELEENGNFH